MPEDGLGNGLTSDLIDLDGEEREVVRAIPVLRPEVACNRAPSQLTIATRDIGIEAP